MSTSQKKHPAPDPTYKDELHESVRAALLKASETFCRKAIELLDKGAVGQAVETLRGGIDAYEAATPPAPRPDAVAALVAQLGPIFAGYMEAKLQQDLNDSSGAPPTT